MIKFFPSVRVQKDTGLDFELLGNICSEIFNKGFKKNITLWCKIHKSRQKEYINSRKTRRKMPISNKSRYTSVIEDILLGCILHELRHAFQQEYLNIM